MHRPAPKEALYILNRGRNAGKPMFEPCPNCFILYVRNREELETYYWTFYALWKNGFFHPHLCGSVIEMLRLSDLKILLRNWIQPGIEKANRNPALINKIRATWELEQKIAQQSKAVQELQNSLVRHYYLAM
ncbi:MAG: hypothetical protein L0G16_01230 [Weeksellaceae bacterium]|nr:hypothetical protein [Weeksellaceae bacterium]